MEQRVKILFLLAGCCSTMTCLPRHFYFVPESKTWTEAQSYCRESYSDLATATNHADMDRLLRSATDRGYVGSVWIGLHVGAERWTWSYSAEEFYGGEGQRDYRNWKEGEPNGDDEDCVEIESSGWWNDVPCSNKLSFICFDEGKSDPYTFLLEPHDWMGAQGYCRHYHTDLAIIRTTAENQLVRQKVPDGFHVWIGLSQDSWGWSDLSTSWFRKWLSGQPDGRGSCAMTSFTDSGRWSDWDCSSALPFVCHGGPEKRAQTVRVELQTESQVNMEDPAVQAAILEQVQQKLVEGGMLAYFNVTWRKQPD